jgi:hypothetical protein
MADNGQNHDSWRLAVLASRVRSVQGHRQVGSCRGLDGRHAYYRSGVADHAAEASKELPLDGRARSSARLGPRTGRPP